MRRKEMRAMFNNYKKFKKAEIEQKKKKKKETKKKQQHTPDLKDSYL
jgi:hypothetical protein